MSSAGHVADVEPRAVWEALQSNAEAVLVDVRTDVEWNAIGIPLRKNSNENVYFISWQFAPDMRVNTRFIDDLAAAGIRSDAPIYFLCRSGVRSRAAAELAAAHGYGPCYNVAEGFEGIAGPDGQRRGGWRGNGLPETAPDRTAGRFQAGSE